MRSAAAFARVLTAVFTTSPLYAEALARGADDPMTLYEAALAFAEAGRSEDAFEALVSSVDSGLIDDERVTKTSSFEKLRADARWAGLVERIRGIGGGT